MTPTTITTMRAKEAAAYLGFSYWKLMELRKAGKIPHIHLDGLILFRKETLDAWLAEQESTSIQQQERKQESCKIHRLLPL
jgi:excisionase family DNA binding protein